MALKACHRAHAFSRQSASNSAMAIVIADDELQGAHYMSAETAARLGARP